MNIFIKHCNGQTDMIFVKKFTRPEFLGQKFYPKKRVNRENGKFTTKQRKSFKSTKRQKILHIITRILHILG